MIYSILPLQLPEENLEAVCVKCPYGYLEGVRDGEGGIIVSRMISTDPAAYLDPRFTPGQVYREGGAH